MMRSILPCKHREASRRYKARVSRRARRSVRRAVRGEPDEAESGAQVASRRRRREMTDVVWFRRGADKVNPFIRWGRARTEQVPREADRYFALRAAIPARGVIVDHALGHFVDLERTGNPHFGRGRRGGSSHPRPWPSEERLARLLQAAFERDHQGLNRLLKRYRLRLCTWTGDCRRNRAHAHAERECVQRLLVRDGADLARVVRAIWVAGDRPVLLWAVQDEPSPRPDDLLVDYFGRLGLQRLT